MTSVGADPRECVRRALAEDLGSDELVVDRDVTSSLSVATEQRGRGGIRAKAAGVLAGVDCAVASFRLLDADCVVEPLLREPLERAAADPRQHQGLGAPWPEPREGLQLPDGRPIDVDPARRDDRRGRRRPQNL